MLLKFLYNALKFSGILWNSLEFSGILSDACEQWNVSILFCWR
jgi:hypothetical protein